MVKRADRDIFQKGNSKKPKQKKTARTQNIKRKTPKSKQFNKIKLTIGLLLFCFGIFLLLSIISYFFTWDIDESYVRKGSGGWSNIFNFEHTLSDNLEDKLPPPVVNNWMGKFGALISHLFVYNGFGIISIIFPLLLFNLSLKLILGVSPISIYKSIIYSLLIVAYCSIVLAFFNQLFGWPSWVEGAMGFTVIYKLNTLIGVFGTSVIIILSFFLIAVWKFNLDLRSLIKKGKRKKKKDVKLLPEKIEHKKLIEEKSEHPDNDLDAIKSEHTLEEEMDDIRKDASIELTSDLSPSENENTTSTNSELEIVDNTMDKPKFIDQDVDDIQKKSEELVEKLGKYDPEKELSDFILPSVNLLNDYESHSNKVSKEELEGNKEVIVKTLKNYKIEISRIMATIGPTVTLYEIVPAPGVRISKIKNLEDDIALSLAALGIRIIAPVPGRGTIGIEVPNQKAEIVTMKSMLTSGKFKSSNYALPVCLGKTISNEIYIADLAKMPHLLVAGATGQGKSVGINAILASLLYSNHPALLKMVLIDPKKVELSLYNKIERHYLAKLPDEDDEPIITETNKVVHVLNSLCKEMDMRYDLLKDAQVKNLKEYNVKFCNRQLNPENGHQFMPYIVLVIDEFADLIMTAGKEVELPIARLAQLARAIGIHLVIATQRPSVNIITGTIKANFPARIAFKVQSKIDSRTILDGNGADQLIGRGDMLLSFGSDIIRLQCPFIDTEEVEKISEFIGSQRAFSQAYMLPEYEDENSKSSLDVSNEDFDPLFEEAARLIIAHQQGSTSLIQRKLKLGYNRAGRIMDQLEAAGVVGPFEGSKAREVLFGDEHSLNQFLENLNKNEK